MPPPCEFEFSDSCVSCNDVIADGWSPGIVQKHATTTAARVLRNRVPNNLSNAAAVKIDPATEVPCVLSDQILLDDRVWAHI